MQRQDVARNLREQQRAMFEPLIEMSTFDLFVLKHIHTLETLRGQEI